MTEENDTPATTEQLNNEAQAATQAEESVAKEAHKTRAKKAKPEPKKRKYEIGQVLELDTSGKDFANVIIADDENDPHWDPKLKNPVPEALIKGMAEFGWDPSSQAKVVEQDGKLKVTHGRTRIRAVGPANKLRHSKFGYKPLVAYLLVTEEDSEDLESTVHHMRSNNRLNFHQQKVDPMTLAESIVRSLSAGVDEKQVADDHSITVKDLHGYLLFTDEERCPPKIQEMLREGLISTAAAMALVNKAEDMTKAELNQAAEQLAKAAAGGLRVTSAAVKKAAGVTENNPATQKQKKELILQLNSSTKLAGKHGEAAKWAAIIALEVGLGTKTIDQFWYAIDKIAKGNTVKVDFKQYGDEPEKTKVKGQD